MDAASLRAEFPVLERLAYLNAGTDGPVPAAAVAAAREALAAELAEGRVHAHFERRRALLTELRETYARVLGAPPEDVALATSTSDGIGRVMAGLDLGPDDEIVTSDQEHPGLVGPLIAARRRGAKVRAVRMRELADAVGPRTTLVACSHVNWVTGETAPAELARTGVPVVFDGAQGAGAVPLDVKALGCAAYAASGQKWMCGADGTGMLYLAPEFRARVRVIGPGYLSFADPSKGLESTLRDDGPAYDTPSLSRETVAFSLAAARVLEAAGLPEVHAHAAAQAGELARRLAAEGRRVAPRGDTTLVSWEDADPPATRLRLLEAGVAVRDLPGTSFLRASVGAWNDASDLERLLAALA
jgi:selenocysteine lyase/cysteine desulfurase